MAQGGACWLCNDQRRSTLIASVNIGQGLGWVVRHLSCAGDDDGGGGGDAAGDAAGDGGRARSLLVVVARRKLVRSVT